MALPDLEKWVCTENIARFRVGLLEQADNAKHKQLTDMLARELAKLQAMFPG